METLAEVISKGITLRHDYIRLDSPLGRRARGIPSLLMAGGGIYHCLSENSYLKAGTAFMFPSLYTGYHLFKHRHSIENEVLRIRGKFRSE